MRRGEVRFVDFEPVRGDLTEDMRRAEANKTRPAVIVSNDGANATADRSGRGVVTVVPLSSNTERVYAFQVLLRAADTGLPRDSKVQAEQVRSIAVERIGRRVGAVPAGLMADVDAALRLHLGL
jgi:mRNA interferase MazF